MTSREERTAIVTGGAKSIGRAISEHLAENGHRVVVFDLDDAAGETFCAELNEKGHASDFFTVDLSDVENIRTGIEKVGEKYGRIDVLVNNAGILHTTDIEEVTEEEWDKVINCNLKGTFFASQKVLPYMKKQHKGRIINISSLAGRMGGIGTGMAYTASKAGVIGLTRGMATKCAPFGITVNAVAPGTTRTPMAEKFSPQNMEELLNRIPLGHLIEPEDIAKAVGFLASDAAGSITGVVLDVNGGMYLG